MDVLFHLFDHATHDPFSHSASFRSHTVTCRALQHSLGTARRRSFPPLNLHRARVRRKSRAASFKSLYRKRANTPCSCVRLAYSRFRYNTKTSRYWVVTNSPHSNSHTRSLKSEHRLAEVIVQMVGAAQKDGEAIARSIFREIFFRYGRVPLEPVGPRHFLKPLRQFTVYGFPCLANLFVRRNGGLGLVGIGYEGDIKLGMKPISQPQQRQHRVMHGREMPPQIKQPVPARRYFPQDLLGREASKKLVRQRNLRFPHLQPESHIRAFVCHSSVSFRLLPLICTLKKSFRTWELHFSIALLWPHPE